MLVLERHYTAGGYAHVFKRRGYEWDVGLHYVGEVHRRNCYLRKPFDYVTDGQLQWAEMGEVYDRVRFGDREYAFKAGPPAFAAQLAGLNRMPNLMRAVIRRSAASRLLGYGALIIQWKLDRTEHAHLTQPTHFCVL